MKVVHGDVGGASQDHLADPTYLDVHHLLHGNVHTDGVDLRLAGKSRLLYTNSMSYFRKAQLLQFRPNVRSAPKTRSVRSLIRDTHSF